jgi:hypothetical protein
METAVRVWMLCVDGEHATGFSSWLGSDAHRWSTSEQGEEGREFRHGGSGRRVTPGAKRNV